jgi:2-polyprenyl-6-methoxyphenol hydroxylase-like FAD-dependent oxidoreductase
MALSQPNPPARPGVLIAGAGPTGLTLALWLTKLGVAVRIVDKLDDAAPYSRALGVQARTLELYRQLDDDGMHLAEEAVESGVQVAGVNFWVAGRKRARVAFGNIGEGQSPFPYVLTFAQDAHERMLLRHLGRLGVHVERSTELLRFEQQPAGVRAVVRRAGGEEETVEASYLAGCDGARSAVREQLGMQLEGGTYSRLFYVADVDAAGPPVDREIHVDLDESDLLAIFPMDGATRVRLVGTIRDDAPGGGDDARFEDVGQRAIERMQLQVLQVNGFSTYRVHHRMASHFREGRAFLLGDAAHIHSPVGAQGMNTGIGDAVNLAWKLTAVLAGRASDRLLDSYEAERIPFARRLLRTTDRIFTLVSKPGPIAEQARTKLVPAVIPLLLRIPFLRAFLFRTVSQLAISYRGSPLSAGTAGRVQGGDRLPWVPNAGAGDNFAFVNTLTFQVHVYGDAPAALAEACSALDLPLHRFAWTPEAKRAGLQRHTWYLVRPDSYLAMAGIDPNELHEYFTRLKR